jgi:hypothetical protein
MKVDIKVILCVVHKLTHWLDKCTINYVPQTKFGRHIAFAPFLIIKSPNEVWELIVFAPFLLIMAIRLLGYFRSFASIVHSMLKLRNHFRLVLLVYWFISLHTCCCLARILRCSLLLKVQYFPSWDTPYMKYDATHILTSLKNDAKGTEKDI